MTEAGVVHVFLSRGRFSSEEDIRRHYVDQRWSESGDAEPSMFMGEAITEFTPMCVEVIHAQDIGHLSPAAPAVLLREASYADQWLSQVEPTESAEPAAAAICVFAPHMVTNPHGTSLRYLGQFAIRA